MRLTLHTYLCRKRLTAISVAGRPSSAISVSDGVVKAKMVPVGFNPKLKTVYAKIIGLGANPVDCVDPEPFLRWTRKALVTSNGDFAQLERLITIEANIPDLPCSWEAAHIYGVTLSPADHRMLLASVPDRSGGEIPSSKSDVSRLETGLSLRNIQTNIVPGEMLQLAWTIKVDNKVYSKPVAGAWFDTPAFTGGKLIEKTTNENTNSYMVSVIGEVRECLATDWAQYPVGSWVYVLKQSGSQAEQCRRNSNFGSEDVDSFYFRLMPITVNGFGNEGGVFEKKSYSMMSASEFGLFFETSVHPGVILEVYTETDKARVSVQKLGPDRDQAVEFNQVPIFYHCEGSETVVEGSAAFAENDEVLVLNEGGGCSPSVDDLAVIGFKDKVKDCATHIKVTIKGSSDYLSILPSWSMDWKVRLTQPIPTIIEGSADKGPYEEDYLVLWTGQLDRAGTVKVDESEFSQEPDPELPMHLWIKNDGVFEVYTTDWRGIMPQFAVRSNLTWIYVPSEMPSTEWETAPYKIDPAWGIRKDEDITNYPRQSFQNSDGNNVSGIVVDFPSPKRFKADRFLAMEHGVPCRPDQFLNPYVYSRTYRSKKIRIEINFGSIWKLDDSVPLYTFIHNVERNLYPYVPLTGYGGVVYCDNCGQIGTRVCRYWGVDYNDEVQHVYSGASEWSYVEDKGATYNQPSPCVFVSRDGIMAPESFVAGDYFVFASNPHSLDEVFCEDSRCNGEKANWDPISMVGWYAEDSLSFALEDIF